MRVDPSDSATNRPQPRWFPWAVLVCLSLDLLKHLCLLLAGPMQPWPDSFGYWRLGQNVVQGDWWQIHSGEAYRTPVYPWFLGLLQGTCGAYALFAVILLQHLMELITSWLTSSAVWKVTKSPRASLFAYVGCIGLTARCLFANTILTETPATFLFTLLVWLVVQPKFANRNHMVVFVGLICGLAVLERPAAVAFIPGLIWAAAMLVPLGTAFRQRALRVGILLGIILAMILPWCVRNSLVWNRFNLSVFLGRELWSANFSPWPGAHLVVPETGPGQELRTHLREESVNLQHNWSVASGLARQGLNDAELDDLMRDVAIQAIREHPLQVGLHTLARCLTFWYVKDWELPESDFPSQEPWKDQQTWSFPAFRQEVNAWLRWSPERFFRPMWGWTILTWFGVFVLVRQTESRHTGVVMAGMLLGITVLTAILEIPCYRYRCIIEPAMIVCTVAGIQGFFKRFLTGNSKTPRPL